MMIEQLITERLNIKQLNLKGTTLIHRLLNEQSFIENITDKGVRALEDTENYLQEESLAMAIVSANSHSSI